MAQLDYNMAPARAFAGLGARNVPGGVATGLNEESEPVGYGLGVVAGTGERSFVLPSDADETLFGVTLHKHRDVDGIPEGSDNVVMFQGDIWVVCEEAIALGDAVFCQAEGANPGQFRNDSDTDKAIEVTGARWLTDSTTGADGETIALLRLNLPA